MTTEQTVYVVRRHFDPPIVFATEDLARTHCVEQIRARAQHRLDTYGWLPLGEQVPEEPQWRTHDGSTWPVAADGLSGFGISYFPLPVRTAA